MVDSAMHKRSTALGRKLISQLGDSSDSDALTRWIANYIAECITLSETATGPKKHEIKQRCHEAILALWAKRNSLPDGLRPFQGFEPIFRALAALDLKNHRSYYLTSLGRESKPPSTRRKKVADKFVEFVLSIDNAARTIIAFSIEAAVETASTPALRALLEEARTLTSASDIDLLIRLMPPAVNEPDEKERYFAAQVQHYERQVDMLKGFFTLYNQVLPILTARLEKARRAHHKALHKASRSKSK